MNRYLDDIQREQKAYAEWRDYLRQGERVSPRSFTVKPLNLDVRRNPADPVPLVRWSATS